MECARHTPSRNPSLLFFIQAYMISQMATITLTTIPQPPRDLEFPDHSVPEEVVEVSDLSKRAQWLRAAVLGANDGLLSTASLMMGVGAVRQDVKSMVITGFAGLIAGACSMAIGELVSVYSQYDIEYAQIKRDAAAVGSQDGVKEKKEKLPNPWHAAVASALSFAAGALVPLFAAMFVRSYKGRLGAVVGAVSVALAGFGWVSAVLGNAPVVKSSARVLIGGLLAMGITFGLTKSLNESGL